MKYLWVTIRSVHVVKFKVLGMWLTYCGRYATADPVDRFPGGRSCESCLRATARLADA